MSEDDAIPDAQIDPTDQQDRFVTFRRLDLESRIKELEEAVAKMSSGNVAGYLDILEKRVGKTELAIAKQRQVNANLWDWFRDDSSEPISESLAAAFEEVLK